MTNSSTNPRKSARIVISGPGVVAARQLVRVRQNESAGFDAPVFTPLSLAPEIPREPAKPSRKDMDIASNNRSFVSNLLHSGYASFLVAVLLLLASAMFLTWTHTEQRRLGFDISTLQKQEKLLLQESQEYLADVHELAPIDKIEAEAIRYGMRDLKPGSVVTLPRGRMIN